MCWDELLSDEWPSDENPIELEMVFTQDEIYNLLPSDIIEEIGLACNFIGEESFFVQVPSFLDPPYDKFDPEFIRKIKKIAQMRLSDRKSNPSSLKVWQGGVSESLPGFIFKRQQIKLTVYEDYVFNDIPDALNSLYEFAGFNNFQEAQSVFQSKDNTTERQKLFRYMFGKNEKLNTPAHRLLWCYIPNLKTGPKEWKFNVLVAVVYTVHHDAENKVLIMKYPF